MKIRTIIVDDESMARGVIRKHLEKLEVFELVHECSNAIEAINILQTQEIDLVFLDIEMPEISGLDFLKTLRNPPLVVLATAYSNYGVESYEFENVVDYLLKPISFDRFLKTTQRIFERLKIEPKNDNQKDSNIEQVQNQESDSIFLKANKKIHKIITKDISHLQAYGNYVKVFTKSKGMILVLQKLQDFEDSLPSKTFVRIHKSFIINIDAIETIESNRVFIDKQEMPIGITYKAVFDNIIKGRI